MEMSNFIYCDQENIFDCCCFSDDVIKEVAAMKELLEYKTGRYPSYRSKAHITVNNFAADEKELLICKKYMEQFCRYLTKFEISLIKIDLYKDSGTIYLALDNDSKKIMSNIMREFNRKAPFKIKDSFSDPHVTIGRKLTQQQIATAYQLWHNKSFDIKYVCDNLAIREFNPSILHYSLESRFYFKGEEQLTLFS
jgi:2'-5' RNA ligase